MKKLILTVIAFVFLSCIEHKPFKKPFVIFDKKINIEILSNKCLYQYQDANGRTFSFYDYNNKYNIGDTIR